MSKRDWFAAILAGLILFSGSGQAQQDQHEPQGQTRAQQDRPADPLGPIRIEIIEDQAAADARKRREEQADEREIHDLAAQRGMHEATDAMNEATQRMASYSLLQTWFVGVGTALLLGTLFLTIGANRAATAAAKEAAKANAILLADQRPWVAIKTPKVTIHSDDGTFPVVFATVETSNLGKSPALDVDLQIRVDFPAIILENSAAPAAFADELKASHRPKLFNTVIFPKNETPLTTISEQIDNAVPMQGSVRLLVCVTYRAMGSEQIFHAARAFRFNRSAFNDVDGEMTVDVPNVQYIRGSDTVS